MNVRRTTAVAALLVAAPLLASCGFGEQTDQVYNASVGVDDRSSQVDVLNTLIVSGTGGSGTVVAGLVNNDPNKPDRLTGITGSQGVTPQGPGGTGITIPAGGMASLGNTGAWSVSGPAVKPGLFVKLTFNFQRAQSVTLDVPVVSASDPMFSAVPTPGSASSAASPSTPATPSTSPSTKRTQATGSASPSVSPSASPSAG